MGNPVLDIWPLVVCSNPIHEETGITPIYYSLCNLQHFPLHSSIQSGTNLANLMVPMVPPARVVKVVDYNSVRHDRTTDPYQPLSYNNCL